MINPHNGHRQRAKGLIDTGAYDCALPASFADILGHDLKKGRKKIVNGICEKATAYVHTVRIEIPKFATEDVEVDFVPGLDQVILGANSFLSHFKLIIDYPEMEFSLIKK